jgi:streptogramin lyase
MPRTRHERIAAMRTSNLPKLFTAALTATVLASATASAAPVVDRPIDLGGEPHHLALGPDGNIWVALDGVTSDVVRVTPDGRVTGFQTSAMNGANGIVAGPDGNLWVTQNGGVARFSPNDPTRAVAFPVADIADPRGIVTGPDGNLWAGSGANVIQIHTDGRARSFPVARMSAKGIAVGSDGALYIADTDFDSPRVVRMTTAGTTTFIPTGGGPQELAAGPNGQIAVTNPGNTPQQLGRFAVPGGAVQTTNVPLTDPFGIVYAQDGAYWIASFARDGLMRMTTDGTVTTLPGFPRLSGPRYMALARDGTLWVGLEQSRQIVRVTGIVAPPTTGGGGTGGGGGGPTVDRTPPTLSHVVFPLLRVGRSATLKLTLSEAATVRVRWERKLAGRRATSGRCVKPRRARHGRRCARYTAIGTQTRTGIRGANSLALGGKLGRRTLPVGTYRLTIVATDAAGNASTPITRRLQVVARPHRRAARHR